MNSLPPELLFSIMNLAADCSSIYESWDTRMDTLLSLTLVNKAFHEIAQPLVPQKFFFKEDEDVVGEPFEKFMRSEVTTKIESLTFEPKLEAFCYKLPILFGFENLTELRVQCCADMTLQTFKAHNHLSRMTLYDGYFDYDPEADADISLRTLVELTLEDITLFIGQKAGATSPLLSESHFPSLRALGFKQSKARQRADQLLGRTRQAVFSDSLIARLDCLTTNDKHLRTATPDLPIPVPHLFDIRSERSSSIRQTANGPTRFLKFKVPSSSYSYLRIRIPCEPIPSSQDIKSALKFAHKLLKESINLEELYLDLYPRDGRRGYILEKELEEKVKELEEKAREKKVEIIWENHEDDWCQSRVSKEFWRRCKEKKERELREG